MKIGVINQNAICNVVDGLYEYKKIGLNELASKYITIPLSITLNTEMDIKRAGVFSYLRVYCGLNGVINCTVPDIVEWYGGKPDKRMNGSNDKTLFVLDSLSDEGYFTYLTKRSKSSFMKLKFNMDYHQKECLDAGFSIVYLDEIEKIMNYKKENVKDGVLNNTSVLLTFAYLRNKIWRRKNLLMPEERTSDGIKNRRERIPEAFDSNINNIATELNISSKTVSKIIDILEYDLSLIVTDRAYRIKNENGEYRTLPTIFANAYKREDGYLLDTGDNYSRVEIENKANNIQGYKIDKRKRKTM